MNNPIIWHNPRCSKSRETLALIQEEGLEPVVVEYRETPPTETEIRRALELLGIEAFELVRKGEAIYKELKLADVDNDALIASMAKYPILIERPIVFHNGKAAIGRPPEVVKSIL